MRIPVCPRAPQTLCPRFIYIRRTEPMMWSNHVCLQTNLCKRVRALHYHPTVHPDICESISCLKRRLPPLHLTLAHARTWRACCTTSPPLRGCVCVHEPVCTGGGRGVYCWGRVMGLSVKNVALGLFFCKFW